MVGVATAGKIQNFYLLKSFKGEPSGDTNTLEIPVFFKPWQISGKREGLGVDCFSPHEWILANHLL